MEPGGFRRIPGDSKGTHFAAAANPIRSTGSCPDQLWHDSCLDGQLRLIQNDRKIHGSALVVLDLWLSDQIRDARHSWALELFISNPARRDSLFRISLHGFASDGILFRMLVPCQGAQSACDEVLYACACRRSYGTKPAQCRTRGCQQHKHKPPALCRLIWCYHLKGKVLGWKVGCRSHIDALPGWILKMKSLNSSARFTHDRLLRSIDQWMRETPVNELLWDSIWLWDSSAWYTGGPLILYAFITLGKSLRLCNDIKSERINIKYVESYMLEEGGQIDSSTWNFIP